MAPLAAPPAEGPRLRAPRAPAPATPVVCSRGESFPQIFCLPPSCPGTLEPKERGQIFEGEKQVQGALTVLGFVGKCSGWEFLSLSAKGLTRVSVFTLCWGHAKAASSKVNLTCFLYLGIHLGEKRKEGRKQNHQIT